MVDIADTPYQAARRLLTGHFHEGSGYRSVRRNGVGDWLMIHTLGGRGRIAHAEGELIVGEGDWVLLPPGVPHDYGVEASMQSWELVWAHFYPRKDWLDWLAWPGVAHGPRHLHIAGPAGKRLGRQFLEVHRALEGRHRRREELALNALEALILGCDDHNRQERAGQGDARIRRALDYIDQHLSGRITVESVADAAGLSASRLAHLFREETGETVQGHIEARRMHLAIDLLGRTGFPIKQIAAQVGFESQFYFSQRFRRRLGQSPLQFRRQQDRGEG